MKRLPSAEAARIMLSQFWNHARSSGSPARNLRSASCSLGE
jgi:hypothetical protein